jgi:hypothetical protein
MLYQAKFNYFFHLTCEKEIPDKPITDASTFMVMDVSMKPIQTEQVAMNIERKTLGYRHILEPQGGRASPLYAIRFCA